VGRRGDQARCRHSFDIVDQRLARLEQRMDELAHEIRAQTWKLTTLLVAMVGVVVAAVRL
jgi:hypothetical protein